MICPPCRDAGKYLSAGNAHGAELHHEKCKGGTWCDCAHKLESVVKGPEAGT